MKIKRFFAKDMRAGIRQVRDALGADAVILSNNQVSGGIEIVAAVDYDESLLTADTASDLMANPSHHNKQTPSQPTSPQTPPSQFDAIDLEDDSVTLASEIPASRRDTPREAPAAKAETREGNKQIVWSQDPMLVQMQGEIKELRDLLEQQLSSLAWGTLSNRDPLRAKLIRCLLELGLSPKVCQKLAEAAGGQKDFEATWRQALALLAGSLAVDTSDSLDQGGVVALVGATGVGKTTTIAKLAARYALRHGRERVALVTTDSYRIAAHEQLRTYGRILGIPVRIANSHAELSEALKLLSDKDLILIDTAGMSQRDVRLSEQFALLGEAAPNLKTFLVLSTTTHRSGLGEVVKAFGKVKLDGCILTKLDETTSLGGALSTAVEHKLPVAYVSDGQRVPEDIHIARAPNLIQRAVLVAQQTSQALEQESLNLAFSGMVANAHG
jgi:flagellar biosynthesis protein FlhF